MITNLKVVIARKLNNSLDMQVSDLLQFLVDGLVDFSCVLTC